MSWLAEEPPDVPTDVTTLTLTLPVFVGATAVMTVGESTVKFEETFDPKYTADAPENPAPVIVTVDPPPAETALGESAVTDGPPGFSAGLAESEEGALESAGAFDLGGALVVVGAAGFTTTLRC